MENPFKKLFGGGEEAPKEEPSMEEKKVVEIITDTEDGIVYWWKRFEDGSEDHMNKQRLNVEADNTRGVAEELNQIRSQYSLDLEVMEEM